MLVWCSFVILFAIFGTGESAVKTLPPYIVPCRRSDPEINKCIIEHGNHIISKIRNGDKQYKISSISPLKVLEAVVESGSNLKLTMRNFDVIGLDKLKIHTSDVKFAKDDNVLKISADIPKLQLVGDYEIDGKILILPITGKGKSDIAFDNLVIHVEQKFNDNGKSIQLNDITVHYDTKKVHFDFENLFNGDERLGPELNKFMNENWEEINKELETSFSGIVANIIKNFAEQILKGVPYDDVFLP